MGIFFNTPPQQFVAGQPLLETLKGVPPGILNNQADQPPRFDRTEQQIISLWWREVAPLRPQRNFFVPPTVVAPGDSVPFGQGWLAGVFAWWDQTFAPTFVRGFIVQGAAVENPPARSAAILNSILAQWREQAPVPMQLGRDLVQPRVGGDPPLVDPAGTPQMQAILATWRDPPPMPRQTPTLAVQSRVGDDPPPRMPDWRAVRAWWLDPAPIRQAPVFAVQAAPPAPVDNPPPLSRVTLGAIVASWREPPPMPRQAPVVLIQTRASDEPPRSSGAVLASIIGQWRAPAPGPLQLPRFVVQGAAVPEQVAFARLWLPAVLLRQAPDMPRQRGPIAALIPPPPPPAVDEPPRLNRQVQAQLLASWQSPFVLRVQRMQVVQGGSIVPPEVWTPTGMQLGRIGSGGSVAAGSAIGAKQSTAAGRGIGSKKA